ncbi:MAG: molybdate ABC transporter substrate-binding protein [SAR202 cluster bacterium]|nr:molybdate ABC transporter substrate-binding protein [SAR202 cluster bacterium]
MTSQHDIPWRGGTATGIWVVLVATVVLFATVSACGPSPETPTAFTVFAASSLTEAFIDLKTAFEQSGPGVTVVYNFAGSAALRTQLQQGARADVFASADEVHMGSALKDGLIDGEPAIFATNRLVVISPIDRRIASLADLTRPGLKLVLAGPDVPAGAYARQSLAKMNGKLGLSTDFADRVLANLVSNETNVRRVVSKVALGEADAGVAYVTDLATSARTELAALPIPDEINVLALYPIGAVRGGDMEAARAFIAFVLSEQGQEILRARGFGGAP